MNREIVMAKIKRQQAEIKEMLVALKNEEVKFPRVTEVLRRLHENSLNLIQTLEDDSLIVGPRLDVNPEIDQLKKGVKTVKSGVERMKKLDEEKGKIADDIADKTDR